MRTNIYKLISFILLTVMMISTSVAQNCFWSNHAGGNGFDLVKSASSDKEGNLYVAGTTASSYCYFETDTIIPKGIDDMIIVKYDQVGNETWVMQLGGNNTYEEEYESIGGIIVDSIRNRLLVCGTFYQFLNAPGLSLSGDGLTGFVLCLDLTGNVIWGKTIPSLEPEFGEVRLLDITYDELGNVYISGCTKKEAGFDGIVVNPGGFLAKYDQEGNILWAETKFRFWNQYPSFPSFPFTEAPPFNISCSNNSIFVNGETYNDTLIVDAMIVFIGPAVTSYVASFTLNGDIIYFSHSGGPKCYSGHKIVIDSEGSQFITGQFEKSIGIFGNDTIINFGSVECYLSKLDSSGKFIWTSQMFTNEVTEGAGLALDVEGNIYLSGQFAGDIRCGTEIITASSWMDMFLAKFSSEGNCVGLRKYSKGTIRVIIVDNQGNLCLAGSFEDTLEIGPNTFTSRGWTDLFASKCSPITGIPQPKEPSSNTLVIYANPTTGQCNVTIPEEFRNEKNLRLQIFDQTGRVIQEAQVEMNGELVMLDISAQAKGMYLAVLSNGTKNFQGKIVFE